LDQAAQAAWICLTIDDGDELILFQPRYCKGILLPEGSPVYLHFCGISTFSILLVARLYV